MEYFFKCLQRFFISNQISITRIMSDATVNVLSRIYLILTYSKIGNKPDIKYISIQKIQELSNYLLC